MIAGASDEVQKAATTVHDHVVAVYGAPSGRWIKLILNNLPAILELISKFGFLSKDDDNKVNFV